VPQLLYNQLAGVEASCAVSKDGLAIRLVAGGVTTLLTVNDTLVEVADRLELLVAVAVTEWVPLATDALFQLKVYGLAVVALPMTALSILN
jgi:hypothetical protein